MKQALSKGEEKALIQWIFEVGKNGYPPSKSLLRIIAEYIRRECVSEINDTSMILVEYPPLGAEWV